MDVRCRKLNCKYNELQTCSRKGFDIDEQAYCHDFDHDKGKAEKNVSERMFEEKIKFSPFKDIKRFKINCKKTDCVFNEKCDCKSNGLTILDNDKKSASCCNYFAK